MYGKGALPAAYRTVIGSYGRLAQTGHQPQANAKSTKRKRQSFEGPRLLRRPARARGRSPKTSTSGGVTGPRGKAWGASTIYGNQLRGTGILNNELYAGQLVWNRQRFVKDPEMIRCRARPNPEEEWVVENDPALRIVTEEL